MQKQLPLFETPDACGATDLLTPAQAADWASAATGRDVSASNISYLIQYGRIRKLTDGKNVCVSIEDLKSYYEKYEYSRKSSYTDKLGEGLNWALSFSDVKESLTTKHVHRLHPYKGKFIPQLVEYFIDAHTDEFKTRAFFKPGDIILDPFSGSGTTMAQCAESGLNCIGVDVSEFNAFIANCKVDEYDFTDLSEQTERVTNLLIDYIKKTNTAEFETELLNILNAFNAQNFPSPDYKYKLNQGEIDEARYSAEKLAEITPVYETLVKRYGIKLRQKDGAGFLNKWYTKHIRDELEFLYRQITKIENESTRRILTLILSRTMRSCRATTHSDLATLIEPVTSVYYCTKHAKICKPLFSVLKWWTSYCKDTFSRLKEFSLLRTGTAQVCLTGDSRHIDIFEALDVANATFGKDARRRKINGVFSSPPYVGMIDYHEQHAYAYELFGFTRNDESEIGPLYKGKGKAAQKSYVDGISNVLINCRRFLADNYDIFLVANDRHNLYPEIAKKAGMKIADEYKRPVLNRSEKDKNAYSETIFHLKEENNSEAGS